MHDDYVDKIDISITESLQLKKNDLISSILNIVEVSELPVNSKKKGEGRGRQFAIGRGLTMKRLHFGMGLQM